MFAAGKDKLDLATSVAIGSSIQIALFVIPFMVVLAWIMDKPLTMLFDPFETIVLFLSVLIVNSTLSDSRSNWLEGYVVSTLSQNSSGRTLTDLLPACPFCPTQMDSDDVLSSSCRRLLVRVLLPLTLPIEGPPTNVRFLSSGTTRDPSRSSCARRSSQVIDAPSFQSFLLICPWVVLFVSFCVRTKIQLYTYLGGAISFLFSFHSATL